MVAPLAERLREEQGFVIDVGHLAIFGECVECEDMRCVAPCWTCPERSPATASTRDVAAHYGSFNGEQRTLESRRRASSTSPTATWSGSPARTG